MANGEQSPSDKHAGQCERRYRVGMRRDEPFEVTYRCGRRAGHDGACGADDGVPFVIPEQAASGDKLPAGLGELMVATAQLDGLLSDPHPGLFTWSEALHKAKVRVANAISAHEPRKQAAPSAASSSVPKEHHDRILRAIDAALDEVGAPVSEPWEGIQTKLSRIGRILRLAPSSSASTPAPLYLTLAIQALNGVKAWRDSDGNEGFPHELREKIEALLMAYEVRKNGTFAEQSQRAMKMSRDGLRVEENVAVSHASTLTPTAAARIELAVRQAIIDWNRAHVEPGRPFPPLDIDKHEEGSLANAVLAALSATTTSDHLLTESGKFFDWGNAASVALKNLLDAYERRIRSLCTPEQLETKPWECAEFIEARRVLAEKPNWFISVPAEKETP